MTTTNTVASAPHIDALADGTLEKIASFPGDYAQHRQLLADLKEDLVAQCASRSACADISEELRWSLARDMPGFSTDALYVKRYSLLSMAGIVFLGFFVGGLLSGLLGLIDMGGGILRVGAVLGMLYGAEYLSGNPKARTRLLTFLGLGTLTTFAASLAAGILRLASWAEAAGRACSSACICCWAQPFFSFCLPKKPRPWTWRPSGLLCVVRRRTAHAISPHFFRCGTNSMQRLTPSVKAVTNRGMQANAPETTALWPLGLRIFWTAWMNRADTFFQNSLFLWAMPLVKTPVTSYGMKKPTAAFMTRWALWPTATAAAFCAAIRMPATAL